RIPETVIVSTCNRLEVYSVGESADDLVATTLDVIREASQTEIETLRDVVYTYSGADAIKHLFRVTSGLDSLMVGEGQILGQVRDALASSEENGTSGPVLDRVFKKAVSVGKRVRTVTGVSRGAVSVASAAVKLAEGKFDDTEPRNVLVIGAGKNVELIAGILAEKGVGTIIFSNRTFSKAERIARRFGGTAQRLDRLHDALIGADLVISSTAAPHPIVQREDMERVIEERGHHENEQDLHIIDIAVPRDFDPAIADIPGIHLHDMDSLDRIAEENRLNRQKESHRAEQIVECELATFVARLSRIHIEPVISSLCSRIEDIRSRELGRALSMLGELSERDRRIIHDMSRSLTKKILEDPVRNLRMLATSAEGERQVESVRDLFELDTAPDPRLLIEGMGK
ncbi:MAG: glutamyl-tRNA reductase, partial [Methanopyri archaeon]|nr:glutamyl-tRNA reductase [Methanopyri archaeon]